MSRPKRPRNVCCEPDYMFFTPNGIPSDECITLTVDEFEVIRLVDYEKKTHSQAAKHMNISRTTASEIYEQARYKISDCIINGRCLTINGGNYSLCNGDKECCQGRNCRHSENLTMAGIPQKERFIMRIAVTFDNGSIFGHFGHTENFKIYDVKDNIIQSSTIIPTNGSGHGALVGFLKTNCVDVLICGGIGGGAQTALNEAGIKLYGGVTGNADDAVEALINGTLFYDPDVHCDHHDNEHVTEAHHCGEHGCGEHSCNH